MYGEGTLITASGDIYSGQWYNISLQPAFLLVRVAARSLCATQLFLGPPLTITMAKRSSFDHIRALPLTLLRIVRYDRVQNRKEGQGTYKFSDGKQSYQGEFKEDQANGRGKMVYPDDSEYNGQIKNWLKNGEGLLKYSNGMTGLPPL